MDMNNLNMNNPTPPYRVKTGDWTRILEGGPIGQAFVCISSVTSCFFEDAGSALVWCGVGDTYHGALVFTLRDMPPIYLEQGSAPTIDPVTIERTLDPFMMGVRASVVNYLGQTRRAAGVDAPRIHRPGGFRGEALNRDGTRKRVYQERPSGVVEWEIERCMKCHRWAVLSCNAAARGVRALINPCNCAEGDAKGTEEDGTR